MDKKFQLFVRKHAAGVSVAVLTQPHLASFAPDLEAARADLAHVLRKLLERGELVDEPASFDDARLRRVDLTIRALQRGRLLDVPMRFSVLTYGTGGAAGKPGKGPIRVLVPRLA